jgi:hypothetical protein
MPDGTGGNHENNQTIRVPTELRNIPDSNEKRHCLGHLAGQLKRPYLFHYNVIHVDSRLQHGPETFILLPVRKVITSVLYDVI